VFRGDNRVFRCGYRGGLEVVIEGYRSDLQCIEVSCSVYR